MHNELSLFLEPFSIDILFSFKVFACCIRLLCLLDLAKSSLDDLIFEYDALFKFFSGLSQTLLCRPVVSLVVGTLLVELEFERAGHVSLEGQYVEVGVLFH